MAQKKAQPEMTGNSTEQAISVCDVMHENANTLIGKLESLLPLNMQTYSEFYAEYLHSLQDLFGACYISENEILSRMGLSQNTLRFFGEYTKAMTRSGIAQIEMANNIQKTVLQNQIAALKTADQYIHLMLDRYSKVLAWSLAIFRKP